MIARLIFIIALLTPAVAGAQTVLVPTGSVWRYLDNGSNQGTAWRAPTFNDGAWASGPAQLGYGDGGEATVVRYGPNASNKYITTYFRRSFSVVDRSAFSGLTLRLLRDDGAVVYLNGVEIMRSNMPAGTIGYRTLASTAIGGADENAFVSATVGTGALVNGTNVLAVEVHQSGVTSSDLSFDLELIGTTSALTVTRGPYLQMGSATDVVVRWRTNTPSASRVRYGADPAALTGVVDLAPSTTEHEVRLSGLAADTRYYYAIGTPTATLAGGDLTTSS
jgi:acid phosphatase type 7